MASVAMRRLDRTLRSLAGKDVPICLVGESGTGKEVLARRVHQLSLRSASPFVPINCAAIPETLFESELFGHERGAFTGADELARGKVEAAAGGTLFLDEITELPLPMQAKLLRFLESFLFTRVGGTKKIEADVRLVCATLRPLEQEVKRGAFRADLYYRVQGITLAIPPLRERRADIPPLIAALTTHLSRRHGVTPPLVSRTAAAALRTYDWPGNIRELRNVVEQLCLLRSGKSVRLADLPDAIRAATSATPSGPAARPLTLEVHLDRPLDDTIDDVIEAALSLENGNRLRAARRLRIGVRTIQRRLSRVT
ncbi:MAG TPA: sigma-54 dependent transcriptional regulator [Polyangiaceae bacterium]|jgi:DNA-binding NtrC family response regulator|nr:sigma-54 dependent transcriptional regulator [Polyangiaceae bacterium]